MEKKHTVKNDETIMFYLVKHIKELASKMNLDEFSAWYVSKMIIPYCTPTGYKFQFDFYSFIGFKKEPTIDKIYSRVKSIIIE